MYIAAFKFARVRKSNNSSFGSKSINSIMFGSSESPALILFEVVNSEMGRCYPLVSKPPEVSLLQVVFLIQLWEHFINHLLFEYLFFTVNSGAMTATFSTSFSDDDLGFKI